MTMVLTENEWNRLQADAAAELIAEGAGAEDEVRSAVAAAAQSRAAAVLSAPGGLVEPDWARVPAGSMGVVQRAHARAVRDPVELLKGLAREVLRWREFARWARGEGVDVPDGLDPKFLTRRPQLVERWQQARGEPPTATSADVSAEGPRVRR